MTHFLIYLFGVISGAAIGVSVYNACVVHIRHKRSQR
jgi:hypothetical protein